MFVWVAEIVKMQFSIRKIYGKRKTAQNVIADKSIDPELRRNIAEFNLDIGQNRRLNFHAFDLLTNDLLRSAA